jgi:hypothetical protein
MPIDRNLPDAEHDWIAKYRTALKQPPVPLSPLASATAFMKDAKATILSKIGELLNRDALPKHPVRTAGRSRPSPVSRNTPAAPQPPAAAKAVQPEKAHRKLASSE